MRECWPAPERNKGPIAEILAPRLPAVGMVLEIGSGSGQHAAHLARAFPHLEFQPSDVTDEHFASVRAWSEGLGNVCAPIVIDATHPESWPQLDAAAVFCANMIHIAPFTACRGLMRGAAAVLSPGGRLFLYGPFFVDGIDTAPSNVAFDESLRHRNPSWGVRQLSEVEAIAPELRRCEVVPMPANNYVVVLERTAGDRS